MVSLGADFREGLIIGLFCVADGCGALLIFFVSFFDCFAGKNRGKYIFEAVAEIGSDFLASVVTCVINACNCGGKLAIRGWLLTNR